MLWIADWQIKVLDLRQSDAATPGKSSYFLIIRVVTRSATAGFFLHSAVLARVGCDLNLLLILSRSLTHLSL